MQLFGYGEDALTLWALRSRLSDLLSGLGEECSAMPASLAYLTSCCTSSQTRLYPFRKPSRTRRAFASCP